MVIVGTVLVLSSPVFAFSGAGAAEVGRLLSITDRVLGRELEIVFTRAA